MSQAAWTVGEPVTVTEWDAALRTPRQDGMRHAGAVSDMVGMQVRVRYDDPLMAGYPDRFWAADGYRVADGGEPRWRLECPQCQWTGAVAVDRCTCEFPDTGAARQHQPLCGLEPCPRGCPYVPAALGEVS